MKIELGAAVRTVDGKDVGTVDRLILDLRRGEVKSAVIRKGLLLPRDVEVPLTAMTVDEQGYVRLTYTADLLDDLPPFFEGDYTTTPPAGYPVPPLAYPPGSLYWPATYGYGMGVPPATGLGPAIDAGADRGVRTEVNRALRRQDLDNALVGEGSAVKSSDGEHVGDVHRLVFDAETGEVTGLVVRQGVLFTEDVELPAALISSADDGVIYLRAHKDRVTARSRRVSA